MQIKISPILWFLTLLTLLVTWGCFVQTKQYMSLTKWCVTMTSVSSLRCVDGWMGCSGAGSMMLGL